MALNRVALVTGAGSGIGRAVAAGLNGAGYSVVLAGRRDAELEETAAARRRESMIAVPTDVSEPEQVRALFAQAREDVSAGSICCSTTPARARRRFRWKISATSNGTLSSTPTSPARFCARRRRSA